MATRARELLDRSRVLLDRSREAAAQFLASRQIAAPPSPPALEPSRDHQDRIASQEALVGICSSVAFRDLNLVDSLLAQLEEMEAKEDDQDRLAELYRLDHLATRLRRNAENLRVLAGRDASDTPSESASFVDVVRAAMSSIDHYARITIGRVVALGVVGFAADDLGRLLAELLDNAANQSSPNAPVRVSAHLTEQGSVLVRIEDEGIGLPPERLRELNDRLADAPVLDDDAVRHMGIAVVRRLAGRHEMRVWLDRRVPHGTTASVLIPAALVCDLPEVTWSGTETVSFPHASAGKVEGVLEQEDIDDFSAISDDGSFVAALSDGGGTAMSTKTPAPRRPSPTPVTEGVTAGGLPRRVSRSLKNPSGEPDAPPEPAHDPETDQQADHEKLIADLGAFSDGQQEALENQNTDNSAGDEEKPAKGKKK
ncbi:MAG: ATP-binding protein [Pseudonocardiaceae bacterium]|nr:ATP-binding protein [Pseudonocardiaceae bacterium]